LRIPKEDILRGGVSDCRNRTLQKMFQLVNLGEQAGSGFPKIIKNWEQYKWRLPELEERPESNQTLLKLKTISLLPKEIVDELRTDYGKAYDKLSNIAQLALVTVKIDKSITHKRMMEITHDHPHDLTTALHGLVEKGLLCSEGAGRATFYYISGEHPISDFDSNEFQADITKTDKSEHYATKSEHYATKSEHYATKSEHYSDSLLDLAGSVKRMGKAPADFVRKIILEMCSKRELSIKELATLLGRSELTIRTHYVNKLCEQGVLKKKYPNVPHHPKQRYFTSELNADRKTQKKQGEKC
jgi:ATP-dependent DNA helicase RecG